ncbi:DUF2637 domain-containing protein [Streptomyces sp. NPDC059080]|uniref:DUF2637 domain-containing protein n=1 Tax=Streptomyces sp. NPDC059080 TaxID=3346718 RepID=UPI0036B17491
MTTLAPPAHHTDQETGGYRAPRSGGQPVMDPKLAEQYALVAAGTVIVALTAGGFWLSYAHLAEVAGQHGLKSSPVRQWAWPATLDAFIVAGELLMLRAGLRRVTDGWAIALTAVGSVGSIVLNVAGVNGTGAPGAKPVLDYVVAAVPPTAALLAFGVLMRQIHQLVDRPTGRVGTAPEPAADAAAYATEPSAVGFAQSPEPQPRESDSKPRGGRPAGATVEELVEIGRTAAAEQGKVTRDIVRKAIRDKGLTVSGKRLTEVMDILRPELEAAADPDPDRG